MNQRKSLIATAIFGLVITMALPACVVVPDQGHYAGGVVMVAPPAPRVEVAGPAPYAGYVWVGGYWNWVWRPPRVGRGSLVWQTRDHWVDHSWVRAGDGWRMRPGHWERG